MKRAMCVLAAGLAFAASAEAWKAGEGVANERIGNVSFVQRGGGADYGYGGGRQYYTPLGLTLLAWDVPNSMSCVYGLRLNLGCGRFERTYGVDVGAFSKTGAFAGIGANLVGNVCERDADGLQVGVINLVEGEVNGVQIGIVNKAGHLRGLQVGLVNFNPSGISFPILNCGF